MEKTLDPLSLRKHSKIAMKPIKKSNSIFHIKKRSELFN